MLEKNRLDLTCRPHQSRKRADANARRGLWLLCTLCCLLSSTASQSQSAAPGQASPDPALSRSPRDWASDAAHNEIQVLQHPAAFLRYRVHLIDQKGERVREIVETSDSSVARLISRDGRPLTPEENQAERDRLNALLHSPDDYEKHVKKADSDKKLAADLIQMMPDAMLYTYTPGQPQSNATPNRQIVLDYHPNPRWNPPTTISGALRGLEGRIWIDAGNRQVVRMEGHVFKPVNFGWGMLAHIYPGGQLSLEQTDVDGHRWTYTHFYEDITVRALLVKNLKLHTEIHASDFTLLPRPLSYQEAVHQLLALPVPTR